MEKLQAAERVEDEMPGLSEVVQLHPEGELSGADLRAIAQFCFRSAQEGKVQIVLDLGDVRHLDYRGVSALRAAQQLLARAGGDLCLAGTSPYLCAILRAAGAHGQFSMFDSAEAAQAGFAQESFGRKW
jgi:anti-anti-sigma factor